jgi:chemotaxis protein methyltransferase CheR
MVEFHRLNLVEPLLHSQPFHVIFCRNVMIYFNKATRAELVNRLAHCLAPGGYLFIGHSESLNGLEHPYRYMRPAIYRMPL